MKVKRKNQSLLHQRRFLFKLFVNKLLCALTINGYYFYYLEFIIIDDDIMSRKYQQEV